MEALAIETATAQDSGPRPQAGQATKSGQATSGLFDLLLRESAGKPVEAPERPSDVGHGAGPRRPSEAGDGQAPVDGPNEPAAGSVTAPPAQDAPEVASAGLPLARPEPQAAIVPVAAEALPQTAPPATAAAATPASLATMASAPALPTNDLAQGSNQAPSAPAFRQPGPEAGPAPPAASAPAQSQPGSAAEIQAGSRAATPSHGAPAGAPAGASPTDTGAAASTPAAANTGAIAAIKDKSNPRPAGVADASDVPPTTAKLAAKVFAKGQVRQSAGNADPTTTHSGVSAKATVAGKTAGRPGPGTLGPSTPDAPDTTALDNKLSFAGPPLAARGDLTTGQGVTGTADLGARPAGSGVSPALVTEQVAVHIRKSAAAGHDRISIRLHPAELGRIQVKLDLVDDGRVRAAIQADRPETLDLMQRDLRGLERALQDAGLKTDANSLNFSLRDHQGQGGAAAEDTGGHGPNETDGPSAGDEDPTGQGLWASGDGRLDIRV